MLACFGVTAIINDPLRNNLPGLFWLLACLGLMLVALVAAPAAAIAGG